MARLFSITTRERGIDKLRTLAWDLKSVLGRAIDKESRFLARHIISQYLSAPGRATLGRKSGEMARRTKPIPVALMGSGDMVGGVVIGQGLSYTPIHVNRRGHTTTIVPKRAGALAIPLNTVTDSRGRVKPRYQAAGGLRAVPGLFRLPQSSSPDILFDKIGAGNIFPAFVLRKSVTIRARVHPEDIAVNQAPFVTENIQQAVSKFMRSRFG